MSQHRVEYHNKSPSINRIKPFFPGLKLGTALIQHHQLHDLWMSAYGTHDLERMEHWCLLMDNNWSFTSRARKHEENKN